MILQECLEQVFAQLSASDVFYGHGIDNAWDEAVALACYVLELPVDSDRQVLENDVSDVQWQQIQKLMKRRIEERVPVFYLTNQAWFMGLPFYVDERVLIPRSPFSEWIEKRFEPWIDPAQVNTILEIGTGSGCMAIAASYAFPEAKIDALDISDDALTVAQKNVQQHLVTDRVRLIHSDCFKALTPHHQYDLIISNPPYVAQEEIDELPEEYLHEPVKTALYASDQGMAIVDEILKEASKYMSAHAILVVEVGYSDEILIERYPHVPFTWLECEQGGQGLFLLTKEQLENLDVR
jgi:ribosomal protein L3 glutamine methyltransferase